MLFIFIVLFIKNCNKSFNRCSILKDITFSIPQIPITNFLNILQNTVCIHSRTWTANIAEIVEKNFYSLSG